MRYPISEFFCFLFVQYFFRSMVTGSCRRQRPVPLQNSPSARGGCFPLVICNEEREVKEEWHLRGVGRVDDSPPHLRCIALDAGRCRSPVARYLSNLPVTSCPSGVVSSYTLYMHKCLVICYRCPPHHPLYASQVHLC